MLLRTAYHPKHWPMRIEILDSTGTAKTEDVMEHDIAGPLCFQVRPATRAAGSW